MVVQFIPFLRGRTVGVCSSLYIAVVPLSAISLMISPVFARAAGLDRAVVFNIDSQPLDSALIAFSNQAHIQVLIAPDASDTARVSALHGIVSAGTALDMLLRDSGFKYSAVGSGSVRIIRTSSDVARNSDGSMQESIESLSTTQPSNGPEKVTLAEREKESRLEEIVVTAQKREERLRDVPISISVLSGADLDRSTLQSVTDELNQAPGVVAVRGSAFGQSSLIFMRGVTAGAGYLAGASPVGYYLDSIPFGFVKSAVGPDANVYDLERVEVLRGPQGTLYGANAENGVVRILTHDADLDKVEFKARSTVSDTEYGGGNYGTAAAINVPLIENKLAVRGVVDYSDLSGWINTPAEPHVNDSQLHSYRLKLNAQPTEQFSIGISAWRTRDDYGAADWSDASRNSLATLPQSFSGNTDIYNFKMGYDVPSFSVTSATSYLRFQTIGQVDLAIYGVPFPHLPNPTELDSDVLSEELTLTSAAGRSWNWTAGAFYRHAQDRFYTNIAELLPAPIDDGDRSVSEAIYGQVGRSFLDNRWEWALGARYFHDDVLSKENVQQQGLPDVPLIHATGSFNAVTPRAVLTWHANREFTSYVSFSEGFRSGFPQNPPVFLTAPNFPPVQPDKLYSYELGAKGDLWDHRLSLEVALYYIRWVGAQQVLTVPIGNGLSTSAEVNASSVSGPGIDFSFTARPVDDLSLSVGLSWNDLTLDSDLISGGVVIADKGTTATGSPKFTASASAEYTFLLGAQYHGALSVSGNYRSRFSGLTALGAIPDFSDNIFDARAALAIVAPKHWRATVYVDNVTNEYHNQSQQGTGDPRLGDVATPDLAIRERPRTVGLQLDYTY